MKEQGISIQDDDDDDDVQKEKQGLLGGDVKKCWKWRMPGKQSAFFALIVVYIFISLTFYSIEHCDEHNTKAYVKGVKFVNIEKDIQRRDQFVDNYMKHPLPGVAKPTRSDGVTFVPHDVAIHASPNGMQYAKVGCTLAHMRALASILDEAPDPNRWYMICDDDAIGNFTMIPEILQQTLSARSCLYKPSLAAINLYWSDRRKYFGIGFGTSQAAYLVNDDGARWMLETLQDKGFKMPGDIALAWDWYGWLHGTSIKTSFHHESLFSYVQGHGR